MSISNLNKPFNFTAVSGAISTIPLNQSIAPLAGSGAGVIPAGVAPGLLLSVMGTKTGANALNSQLYAINAYPGNAAVTAPVYAAGAFYADITGTNLIFSAGAADTSKYSISLIQF
jgi:hypothetical protein